MSELTQFWSIVSFVFLLLFGYLLGSIPSGYLAGKWMKGIDLRNYGSGTVSGSMVWEHVAKWSVVPVGLFDIFKGSISIPSCSAISGGTWEALPVTTVEVMC